MMANGFKRDFLAALGQCHAVVRGVGDEFQLGQFLNHTGRGGLRNSKPFGDGIGADISPVMIDVVDAAVKNAYLGKKKISWMEIYAGEKATRIYGEDAWLPEESLAAMKHYIVSIKGPLTTPIGGGIRSLNI